MNQPLLEELLSMQARDQACRHAITCKSDLGVVVTDEAMRQLEFVDRVNTYRMQEIVTEYGWPGRSLVGDEGAAATLLLVLHADRDVRFQEACLELLCTAVAQSDVSPKDLAFLTDRVLVNQGRPQRYGTQLKRVNDVWIVAADEDAANVNVRRRALNLKPIVPPPASLL